MCIYIVRTWEYMSWTMQVQPLGKLEEIVRVWGWGKGWNPFSALRLYQPNCLAVIKRITVSVMVQVSGTTRRFHSLKKQARNPRAIWCLAKKTWEFEFNQPPTGTDLLGKPNHKPAALEVHYWVSGCMRQCLSSPLAPGHDWVMWWLMAIVGLPQSVKTMLDPLRSPQVTTRSNKH
jgi:hypothetical protein